MAAADFVELFGASDSEDEDFEGFLLNDISNREFTEVDPNNTLSQDEIDEILEEINAEDRNPKLDAYECEWLKDFQENSGPKNIAADSSPFDIFSHFLNDEIVSIFVTETNRYFDQYLQQKGGFDKLPPKSPARSWKPVSVEEMKAFIGILLYMGLVRLPNYEMYWSTDNLVSFKGLTNVMTRDRFLNILSFFHVANNEDEPPRDSDQYDPGFKLSKVAKILTQQWQDFYVPGREISVDETLVPFKGRIKLLQYIPSKPHKWGIKVWTLADASTGYVYNWSLYTGKAADREGKGIAHGVVTILTESLYGKGHHLYCDNFFTSPALFNDLAENQTGACGTLRLNRVGVPPEVKTVKLQKGDPNPLFAKRDEKILYLCWFDKRQVNCATTLHNDSTYLESVRSKFHANFTREVDHPKAVQHYTKFMGGVDIADQQTSYCVLLHKMLKWWKKVVICNLLEVCVANAKVIWKHYHPNVRPKSEKFRLEIVHGLVDCFQKENRRFGRPVSHPPSRLTATHFPSLNQNKTPAGRRSNPDCEVCSNRAEKKRHQTQYVCSACDMPLCVYPCFERYHTLLDYKITCSPELHH